MRVTIAGYQTDGAGEKIEKFHAHGFLPGPGRAVPPGGQVVDAGEIHRTLGDISHGMLTVTLRMLETDGMIRREVYAEVPPRVEYRLTERGGSLLPHIFGLVEWAEANKEAILDGRRRS